MNSLNGHANDLENGHAKSIENAAPQAAILHASGQALFPAETIHALVAELEIPFDTSVIEWRVTNSSKDKTRGQIMPYADQRAYTDRLNGLFTPAGWTRKYSVHTSSNFERSKDQKTVAKVFVTCDLTIYGIGSHSATGEEWTDDENAGTSAEAQAFKRACSCFGLGRYLYHFTGVWVDLDDRKRPKVMPKLFGWATPKGWRDGLRPPRERDGEKAVQGKSSQGKSSQAPSRPQSVSSEDRKFVQQIEAMEKPLGKGLYRGLLKSIARVWKPADIRDSALLEKVLKHMESAERGLDRLKSVIQKVGAARVAPVLESLNLKSLDHIDRLDTLQKVVQALEASEPQF